MSVEKLIMVLDIAHDVDKVILQTILKSNIACKVESYCSLCTNVSEVSPAERGRVAQLRSFHCVSGCSIMSKFVPLMWIDFQQVLYIIIFSLNSLVFVLHVIHVYIIPVQAGDIHLPGEYKQWAAKYITNKIKITIYK